jgi:hypothetical protein
MAQALWRCDAACMKGTFRGSCHCKAVRFEADIDLPAAPKAQWSPDARYLWTYKCNCSRCWKTRFWKLFVPASAFRLLDGEAVLGDYQFGSMMVHHRFCTKCGVAAFGSGELDAMGGGFYALNVACLDDVSPEELLTLPVRYEDGLHDDWDHEPNETRQL